MGKADYLAEGDWNATCYLCGRKAKASDLVRHWQGFYCHPWHPGIARHPQDFVRAVPENQAAPWIQSFGDTYALEAIITEASDETIVGDDYILTELGEVIFME